MKRVLFDENLDWRLTRLLDTEFFASTVHEMGWAGFENGALLRVAEIDFDVFVTADNSIRFQHMIADFDLSIILIRGKTNRRADIEPLMTRVNRAIWNSAPGQTTVVESHSGAASRASLRCGKRKSANDQYPTHSIEKASARLHREPCPCEKSPNR